MVDEVDEDGIAARVVLDPETDRYVIDCFLPEEAEPVLSLRVPRAPVERAVLDAIGLTLELTGDAAVMVYSEETRLGTLAKVPLLELVRIAVTEDRVGDSDQPDALGTVARALDDAVRLLRERQSRR